MKTKVYIYGLCDVFYDSYYIEGIRKVYRHYVFNISKFPKFKQGTFAVIFENKYHTKKVIIDSRDTANIDIELLKWCDVYGKINYNDNTLPDDSNNKIVAIGPSFGIKIWNLIETVYFALFNFLRSRKSIKNKREFIANYWRQYKRLSIKNYSITESSKTDVFFMNSIWKEEKQTNSNREMFIRMCKEVEGLSFEGGFAARKNGDNLGYGSLVYSKTVPLKKYLNKIKNSMTVFNTPAVLSCHGWKLAEFLALGKAIITTDHYNRLPAALQDHHHVIYANNAEEIKKAIEKLMGDTEYKRKLEFNARKYFEEYLEPNAVIIKLINNL